MDNATYWIDKLGLISHPEGGYFKETYRSKGLLGSNSLPKQYQTSRNFSTSIYFLLKGDGHSKFHILASDELWYYHTGSPLTLHLIHQNGNYTTILLGPNMENNEHLQVTIPQNTHFAAAVNIKDSFTLMSCSVSPGFDFKDFKLASSEELLSINNKLSTIINQLT